MNQGRYFMPFPMHVRNNYGMGAFEKIVHDIRSINWGKFLNGANKTLNVMNQTIPLIRQVKPMVGNVKSMVRLAKAFRSETTNNFNNNQEKNTIDNDNTINSKKEITNNNYPNFFI